MSPGRDSRLGAGRLWQEKGGKVFFNFLEQFGNWAASPEVSYRGFLLILFPEATSFSQAMQAHPLHSPDIASGSALTVPGRNHCRAK